MWQYDEPNVAAKLRDFTTASWQCLASLTRLWLYTRWLSYRRQASGHSLHNEETFAIQLHTCQHLCKQVSVTLSRREVIHVANPSGDT